MSNFIKIFDDIISKDLVDKTEQVYKYNISDPVLNDYYHPKWRYNGELTQEGSSDYGVGYDFFSLNSSFNDTPNIQSNTSFHLNILYNFSSKMNFTIGSVINGRSWLQLPQIPPSSPQNMIHTDVNTNNIPDPNVFVLLYYVNDSDGDTILYEDNHQTELKRVTPKKGRCVFFSNPIPHSAGIPTKNPRMVINYNFTIL